MRCGHHSPLRRDLDPVFRRDDRAEVGQRWATKPLILLARAWQIGPSRLIPPTCRYSPSCSAYAIEAWSRYGALAGTWLALKRIARCHPWGGCGIDPVP